MEGYHNLPEETAEALTEDGWLHTGDIGELDDDGYLRITDRKKDLFKTSGGKYIAPPAIEAKFKAICPYASQFVVHGDERNFCVALITLDPDAIVDWAERERLAGASYAEIVALRRVQGDGRGLRRRAERAGSTAGRRSRSSIILDHDLTVEYGELTPSMKVKRKVVEENYKDDHRRVLRLIPAPGRSASRRSQPRPHRGHGRRLRNGCRRITAGTRSRLRWPPVHFEVYPAAPGYESSIDNLARVSLGSCLVLADGDSLQLAPIGWLDGEVPSTPPPGEPAPPDGSLPPEALAELGHRGFGVYVHVPFCAVRCGYCDFNTYTPGELGGAPGTSVSSYAAAVVAEIRLARRVLGEAAPSAGTVFFGGGTPTLMAPGDLAAMLRCVEDELGLAPGAEITTEANPDSVTAESLGALRIAGFTRISFGMQSAVPRVLTTLHRSHDPERVSHAVAWARAAGFDQVSLDLIYGTPGESQADWATSVEAALACEPDHISAYALIVEEGTALARQVRRGELPAPDDDDLADKYVLADERLSAAGLEWYELSNWARSPAARCRHNELYWTGAAWAGFGPGPIPTWVAPGVERAPPRRRTPTAWGPDSARRRPGRCWGPNRAGSSGSSWRAGSASACR